MPIKSRSKFNLALAAGATRSEAAKKAHVRSRSTAQRWEEQYHLTRDKARKAAQEAETRLQAARTAQIAASKAREVNRLAAEAYRASPEGQAEEAARKAKDVRCRQCGHPQSSGPCSHTKPPSCLKNGKADPLPSPEPPSQLENVTGDPYLRIIEQEWQRQPWPNLAGTYTEATGLVLDSDRRQEQARIRREENDLGEL